MKIKLIATIIITSMLSGCFEKIVLVKDDDSQADRRLSNNYKCMIFFEQYFSDSISVKYNGKIIFRDFVQTRKRKGASEKFCSVDSVMTNNKNKVYLNISKNKFYFKPMKEYRYYYLTFVNKKLGIVFSNTLREYY